MTRLVGALKWVTLFILAWSPQVSGQELRLAATGFATGARPLGVDIAGAPLSGTSFYPLPTLTVVVANSGDDSVSLFRVRDSEIPFTSSPWYTLEPLSTVRGIRSPYAVAACKALSFDRVLVTSPGDNSVTILRVPDGMVLGKITVGPQPHAVACYSDTTTNTYKGLVSNVGDESLTVFDLASLTVEARIPGVAGSRGLHGIVTFGIVGGGYRAWVAGTDADAVTVVNLSTQRVLTRLRVRGPTSILGNCVASAPENSIVCFDENGALQNTIAGLSNPQDFARVGLSLVPNSRRVETVWFASTGANNSVAYISEATARGNIPGIPGASGLVMFFRGVPDVNTYFFVVTSPNSNRVFLLQKASPPPALPREFSIMNGASFGAGAPLAPNSLASLFATTGASRNLVADALPLPTTLGGVSVRVGGSFILDSTNNRWNYSPTGSTEAALWYVGPTQINFQVPPQISPGDAVPAQLRRADGTTLLTALPVVPAAPGIFTVFQNGQGPGAVLNQDNSQNGDPQTFAGVRAAARGSVIQIFATGAGATNPPLLAGEPAPASGNPLVFTQVQPTVSIGGTPARVLFSGMAPGFVGVWQINAEVPQDAAPGPALPLQITAAGVASNIVTIAVQ